MTESDPEERPRITVTAWHRLGLAALVGALLARTGVLLFIRVVGSPPTLPWGIVVIVWLLTLTVAELARSTRRRIHRDQRWIAAARGIRLLAIGKAAAWTGAVGAGAMVVHALGFVGQLDVPFVDVGDTLSHVSARRALVAALTALGCVLLAVAGRILQRACHIPTDPDAEPDPADNIS